MWRRWTTGVGVQGAPQISSIYNVSTNYTDRTTRRGYSPPRFFDQTSERGGSNPSTLAFDVVGRERGGFHPSLFVFYVWQRERGGSNPSPLVGREQEGSIPPCLFSTCLDPNGRVQTLSVCLQRFGHERGGFHHPYKRDLRAREGEGTRGVGVNGSPTKLFFSVVISNPYNAVTTTEQRGGISLLVFNPKGEGPTPWTSLFIFDVIGCEGEWLSPLRLFSTGLKFKRK